MKHASSSDDSSPTRPTQRDRDTIKLRIEEIKQSRKQLNAAINKIQDDFKEYKISTHGEITTLQVMLEDEKENVQRLQEILSDMTDLHENEVALLKEDIGSVEDKILDRLDERTTELGHIVDSFQIRIQRLEQQQQQQVHPVDSNDDVNLNHILDTMINFVIGVLSVIVIFVSRVSSVLLPFLSSSFCFQNRRTKCQGSPTPIVPPSNSTGLEHVVMDVVSRLALLLIIIVMWNNRALLLNLLPGVLQSANKTTTVRWSRWPFA